MRNVNSILVVEDNQANQLLFKKQLSLLGYSVTLVDDALEAFSILENENFDVIFTDINMPGMSGIEFASKLRKSDDQRLSGIPIVAITADATECTRIESESAGIDAFLVKPVVLENLREFLGTLEKLGLDGLRKSKSGYVEVSYSDNESVLDLSNVIDFIGDDKVILARFMNKFIEVTPDVIQEVGTACNSMDPEMITRSSHKLKSSSRSVGANKMASLCEMMEKAGKDNRLDKVKDMYDELVQAFTETVAEMEKVSA